MLTNSLQSLDVSGRGEVVVPHCEKSDQDDHYGDEDVVVGYPGNHNYRCNTKQYLQQTTEEKGTKCTFRCASSQALGETTQ